jgi:hypothetical protein
MGTASGSLMEDPRLVPGFLKILVAQSYTVSHEARTHGRTS